MADIPPELLKLIGGAGGPPGGVPGGPPPPPPGGAGAPVSAPMSTPQPNAGEKRGAMVKVQQAMDLLEQALPEFGSDTEEGSSVLDCLKTLSKRFGGANRAGSKELMPAEIMNLIASLPRGPGGMKPPMPGGGAAPGGMPGMPPGMPPM